MDIASLRAFVKVVQAGSFTGAAELLDTRKAHLSRVVSQLERELGVRLLERTTRSLSLTEVGRAFHERACGILDAVEDAQRTVQQAQGEPTGELRLTCGVEFGMIAVGGWIHRYLQRHPQVRVDADYTGRIVDIVHDGFDLAIRVGTLPDSTLAARRLGALHYGLYAAPGYLARHGTPATPDELDGHETLAFIAGRRAAAWTLRRDGHEQRIALRPRLRANSVFAVRDAAIAGLGIASLPHVVAAEGVRRRQLRAVLADWSLPEVPVHAVFASRRFLTPKVRAFIDLAAEAMGGDKA
jgi:DNA-binding transcriptional LysR family regulator